MSDNYNHELDYQYLLSELSALIISLGGNMEDAETISLDDLLQLLDNTYPHIIDTPPDSPQTALLKRTRKSKNALCRKFIFYRDVMKSRDAQ